MLIEVVMLSMALSAPALRCEPGKRVFTADSQRAQLITVASPKTDPLYSEGLESALAQDLSSIREVDRVFLERAEGNLLVWISATNTSRESRERIFLKQLEIMDAFPEVSFDFNVIPSKNRSAQEFVSEAKLIFDRQG